MIEIERSIPEGFLVPLAELEALLRRISHGSHQWSSQLLLRPMKNHLGCLHTYVAIAYSNPDGSMPNMLCFLFPTLDQPKGLQIDENPTACIHPSAAIPLSRGLYFEGENLGPDLIEDWNRFWEPLGKELEAHYSAREVP